MHLPSVLLRPLVQGGIPRRVQAVLLCCCQLHGDAKISNSENRPSTSSQSESHTRAMKTDVSTGWHSIETDADSGPWCTSFEQQTGKLACLSLEQLCGLQIDATGA